MAYIPEPISDNDKLLHNIIDGTPDIRDLVPTSREEEYLKYIAINGAGGGFSTEILSWTPILPGIDTSEYTISFSDPEGAKYVLLGDLVYITCYIECELFNNFAHPSINHLRLGGLPYKSKREASWQSFSVNTASFSYKRGSNIYYPELCLLPPDSNNVGFYFRYRDIENVNAGYFPYPDAGTTMYFGFSGVYIHG